jgi:hypothetical protein
MLIVLYKFQMEENDRSSSFCCYLSMTYLEYNFDQIVWPKKIMIVTFFNLNLNEFTFWLNM